MRIRLTRNLGTRDSLPPYKAGQEVAAKTAKDKELFARLVERGLAEEIHAVPERPALKAIPPKPTTETNKAKPARTLGDSING